MANRFLFRNALILPGLLRFSKRRFPHDGTTFKVLFPVSGEAASLPAAEGDLDTDWQGDGLILLVDDEESIRIVGKRMLVRLGFEAIVAADGREALAQIREHGDRLRGTVLDLTLPRMDGDQHPARRRLAVQAAACSRKYFRATCKFFGHGASMTTGLPVTG